MKNIYDYIILGAGINGCGIANELSKISSVAVIEKNSVAYGTSSKSSSLIHGGLRYLEQFEFSLVKEALDSREYLINKYPNIVQLAPFYLPIYKNSPRHSYEIKIGLFLYDFFSKFRYPHQEIDKSEFLKLFPLIDSKDLVTVFIYFDGVTKDLNLTKTIAQESKDKGCQYYENCEVLNISEVKNYFEIETKDKVFKTKNLINATGPWIDEVNKKYNLTANFNITKVSGVHIVIGKNLIPYPMILQTDNKRVFFMIPKENSTLIGTTERSENKNSDDIEIIQEDIDYLINKSNVYLKNKIELKDITKSFIGTRALIHSIKDPTLISREYKLDLIKKDDLKLLHIFGGKLTTFYPLSKKVADILK